MGTDGVFLAEPVSNVVGGTLCFVTMLVTIMPELKRMENKNDPNVQATQKDVLLCIVNGKILIHLNCFENKEVVFPKVSDIQVENVEYRYLFSIDSTKYFLCDMQLEENQIPSGYGYVEERSLRIEGIGPKDNLFAAITGKHLADWYRDT